MTTSRNATEYLKRLGLLTPQMRGPVFSTTSIALATYPLAEWEVKTELRTDAQGHPPSDRGVTEE